MTQPQLSRSYWAELHGNHDRISHLPNNYSLVPPPSSCVAADQADAAWRNNSIPIPMPNAQFPVPLPLSNLDSTQSQHPPSDHLKLQNQRGGASNGKPDSNSMKDSVIIPKLGTDPCPITSHPQNLMSGALCAVAAPQPSLGLSKAEQTVTNAKNLCSHGRDTAVNGTTFEDSGRRTTDELGLVNRASEFQCETPEEAQVQYFEERHHSRALNPVSPESSRREQWYAWIMAKELSDQREEEQTQTEVDYNGDDSAEHHAMSCNKEKQNSGSDTSWDWIKEEVEPIMNIQHPSEPSKHTVMEDDSIEIDLDLTYDDGPEPPLLRPLSIAQAGTAADQRHGSGETQASEEMEISPEDQPGPPIRGIDDITQSYMHDQSDATIRADSPVVSPGYIERLFASAAEYTFEPIDCSRPLFKSAEMDKVHAAVGFQQSDRERHEATESEYQRDHRGFQVRPATTTSSPDRSPAPSYTHAVDGRSRVAIAPSYDLVRSNSPYVAQSCVNTTACSTPKRPDTPHPFSPMIRASVERDLLPEVYCRDSTPAYEDRSLTPSPTSRASISRASETDTKMLDIIDDQRRQRHRESSMPPEPTHSGTMLPPPSPTKSRTSSPRARQLGYDLSSPSTLRSPAIARVLHQTQSPHQSTRYPYTRRSPSPSLSRQPPLVNFALEPFEPTPRSVILPSISSLLDMTNNISKPHPLPPPIPEELAQLEPAKRRGRRKSTVQESTAKIVKMRSVTGGVVVNGSGKGKKSIANVKAKQQRQRAVTAGLIQASEGLSKNEKARVEIGYGVGNYVDTEMVMSLEDGIAEHMEARGCGEGEITGKRRSARLGGRRV